MMGTVRSAGKEYKNAETRVNRAQEMSGFVVSSIGRLGIRAVPGIFARRTPIDELANVDTGAQTCS
jgi:hypothetical protein